MRDSHYRPIIGKKTVVKKFLKLRLKQELTCLQLKERCYQNFKVTQGQLRKLESGAC